ncbi:MAG: cyclic nucleotide-binding domain-containing protein [Lachnospiraceae bacterium]|nr:cyclic nucleotide-binding domain-containing protein [Lachnospiraceae bacterium]
MTERQFDQGAVIFREKDPGDSLFLITDGSVGVYSGYGSDSEEKIAEIKAGEYFGEMGLLEGYPRSATVVALSAVRPRRFPQARSLIF